MPTMSESETMQRLDCFVGLMREKLRANIDKESWRTLTVADLLARLHDETVELELAIRNDRRLADVASEAADVANFAMMIADVAMLRRCGE